MKKNLAVWMSGMTLAAGLALPTSTTAQSKPAPAKPAPHVDKDAVLRAESDPKIEAALKDLQSAQENLKQSSNEFGGHRSNAMDHIRKAMEELNKALKMKTQ